MTTILVILFLSFFSFLASQRFFWAVAFFFFLLPSYLIRFQIWLFPTTILELMLGIIFIFWLINFRKKENRDLALERIKYLFSSHKSLIIATALFLLGATIGVLVSIDRISALGEWKAFYIEPILLAFVLFTSIKAKKQMEQILFAIVLSGFVTSLLAIYQHFTGFMVPWDFWENRNTFRVTGWWGFPNGVGIYLAPIIPLAVYIIKNNFQFPISKQITIIKIPKIQKIIFICSLLFIPLGLLAIFYAKSTGALVGIIAGLGFLFLLNKWTRWPAIVAGISAVLFLFFAPQATNIKQEILLQDYSGLLRLNMWAETIEFLSDNPLFGAGLASYQKLIYPYRIDKWIEVFHHPHNQFLTMWVNLGIIGFISFVLLLVWFFSVGVREIKHNPLAMFLLSSMIVLVVMGLVDSPYVKNDTSIVFWLLFALILPNHQKDESGSLVR